MRRDPESRCRRRSGYALIELCTVIILVSTVLGMATILLNRLLRLDQEGRNAFEESATIARLAREFRRDAHEAVSLTAEAETEGRIGLLHFERAEDRRVNYQLRGGTLEVRREFPMPDPDALAGVEVDDGPRTQQESFSFRDGLAVRLDRIEREGQVFAVLIFDGQGAGGSPRALRIESRVGHDHRWESQGAAP